MSDALRELIIAIDFEKVDVNKLTHMDRAVDSVGDNLKDMGRDLDRMGLKADEAGRDGARAMDKIGVHADDATSELLDMTKKTDMAGDALDALTDNSELSFMIKSLDNINGHLAIQERKLRGLRESLDNTFNVSQREKLSEQILKTEKNILSLTKQSDKTAMTINKLEDELSQASREAKTLGNIGDNAMDEIRKSADKATKAVDELGDKQKESGKKGADSGKKFLGVLDEVVPKGKASGMASMLFSNPWVAAGVAVVAAIGGVVTVLAGMANATDRAMDRVQALTGKTGEELKGLQDTAKDVFTSGFGDSLGGVGDDLSALHSKFKHLDNDALGSLAKGLYTLRDLWPEADIKATSQAIKTMTANFDGLSETKAMDLITYAFQNGGDYAGDLLDTMKEYSPYFNKVGIDAEKMTGILLRGADAGAWNLDKVADSVKEIGIRAMDGSDATKEAFAQLGFESDKMGADFAAGGDTAHKAFMATVASLSFVEDKVAQNALGVQLFGTQWEDVGKNVIFAMDGAEKAVEGFEGSTQRASDAARDNFGSKWDKITRTVKQSIGDAFMGEGGAGVGILDNVIASLPVIVSGIEAFAGWFGKLFGGGGEFAHYLEGFAGVWTGIWDVIKGVWFLVGPFLTEAIGGTLGVIWNIAGTMLGAIGDIFSLFGNLLQGNWGDAWQNVKDLFNGILDGMIGIARASLNLFFGIWDSTIGRIFEAVTGIDLTQAGKDMIDGLINGAMEMKDKAIDMVKGIAKDMWGGFKDFFGIHSPSRLMMDGGEFVVEGLAVGIDKTAQDAIDAAAGMSNGIAAVSAPQMAEFGPSMTPATKSTSMVPQTPGAANIASQAAQPTGSTAAVSVSMPITVNVPAGTSSQDSQGIGQAVAEAVNEKLAAIFTQLGIKYA